MSSQEEKNVEMDSPWKHDKYAEPENDREEYNESNNKQNHRDSQPRQESGRSFTDGRDRPEFLPRIVLENLHWSLTVDEIKTFLKDYEPVAVILRYDLTGRSVGTAIVKFSSSSKAQSAKEFAIGKMLNGQEVHARDWEFRRPGGFRGRSFSDNRGGSRFGGRDSMNSDRYRQSYRSPHRERSSRFPPYESRRRESPRRYERRMDSRERGSGYGSSRMGSYERRTVDSRYSQRNSVSPKYSRRRRYSRSRSRGGSPSYRDRSRNRRSMNDLDRDISDYMRERHEKH